MSRNLIKTERESEPEKVMTHRSWRRSTAASGGHAKRLRLGAGRPPAAEDRGHVQLLGSTSAVLCKPWAKAGSFHSNHKQQGLGKFQGLLGTSGES